MAHRPKGWVLDLVEEAYIVIAVIVFAIGVIDFIWGIFNG